MIYNCTAITIYLVPRLYVSGLDALRQSPRDNICVHLLNYDCIKIALL